MNAGSRLWRTLSTLAALIGLALLYLPLIAVMVYSFNGADPETNRRTFEIREAATNTLVLGACSTLISTVLGTLLALGTRIPWPNSVARMLDSIVDIPAVVPDITFAAVLVVAFNVLRRLFPWFENSILTMIIGHVTFQIAFVALLVRSRLVSIGPTVSEAAIDLYASSWYQFRKVTLPLLWPAIAGGAMLAFTLSLDDFVIGFFTSGPRSVTLPIFVYHSQMRGLQTDLFAISTLLVLSTVVFILTIARLARWRKD
jgi:spermidine/putrescine transport system permease protein